METLLLFRLNILWSIILITVSMASSGLLVWMYISNRFGFSFIKEKQTDEVTESIEKDEKCEDVERLNKELEDIKVSYEELEFLHKGIDNFHDIVSKNKESLKKLCNSVLNYLIDYIGAIQGAVFIQTMNDSNHLNLMAGYGLPEDRMDMDFEIGEGNVGTCFKEKTVMEFHPLPKGYIKVGSLLGETEPEYLLIIPIALDEKAEGVLELTFLKKINNIKKQFVEKIAVNLASSITIIKANEENERNMKFLETQQIEVENQRDELTKNMEEMQMVQDELKHQKEELDFEKSMMDAFLKYAPDHVYFKDKESNFLKSSVSLAKAFNLKDPGQLIGKSDFDFFDDEHAKPAYDDEQKIIKTENPVLNKVEKEIKKDGTISYVNTSKMPLYDKDGKVIGTFGISTDITTLKEMEMEITMKNEELQATEEELRQNLEEMMAVQEELQRQKEALDFEKSLMDALMTNLPDHIYFKDLDSKFIKSSLSLVEAFKLKKPDDIIGKSDFDFFDKEHAQPAYEGEQKIIKTKKPILNIIEKEIKKDGKISYVKTSKMPLYDNTGKVMGSFGISSDITELKEMEIELKMNNKELQATEEELRQSMEEMLTVQEDLQRQKEALDFEKSLMDALMINLPDHIYFKDLDSKFIKSSLSLVEAFKLKKPDDIIGKSDFDFFDKEHAQPAYDDEQKIIKTKKPVLNIIEKEIKKDGKISYVKTSKMPLYNREGKIMGTFGISSDITELKELEIELKMNNEELQATEEELRQNIEEVHTIQEDLQRQMKEKEKINNSLVTQNAYLDALMNNLPDWVYFKDSESRFLRVSKSMIKLFKNCKSPEELIGKSDFDFMDKKEAQQRYDEEKDIMRTGKPILNLVNHEVFESGVERWVSITKMPLIDISNKVIGTFGISRDITELKKLEEKSNKR